MQNKVKNRIERQLKSYIRHLDNSYSLRRISPVLFGAIKEFMLRKGKRIRPILLTVGYLGFARKPAPGLYNTALSIELLHDFMLVHDDIIDKSDLRRGKPAMHKLFSGYLRKYKGAKFNGQDLAIVAGDVMYAMAIDTFLSIKENMARKEEALRKFIGAAIYTGIGEFIELLGGIKALAKINKQDIYRIYDYKTAHYTFACPLAAGAILAGAGKNDVQRLYKYGIYLGRAFQFKDDILGMFGAEHRIGKSIFTDLQEGKKTLLIWYAFRNSAPGQKKEINRLISKRKVVRADLLKIRNIIKQSKALECTEKEIAQLVQKAQTVIKPCKIRRQYKQFLNHYCRQILNPA